MRTKVRLITFHHSSSHARSHMNLFSTLSHVSLLLLAQAAQQSSAQAPAKPAAPTLPAQTAASERLALTQASSLLSKGLYDLAASQIAPLTPPPVVRVWIDWTPVPRPLRASYKEAAQFAVHDWNAALAPTVRFDSALREEDADILVL